MKDPCWKNYKMVGTKKKGGKEVPNCVPEEVSVNSASGGNVAGIGVGPQGEPGVSKKKKPMVMTFKRFMRK